MSEIRRVNTGDAPRNVYHAGDAPRTVNTGRTVKTGSALNQDEYEAARRRAQQLAANNTRRTRSFNRVQQTDIDRYRAAQQKEQEARAAAAQQQAQEVHAAREAAARQQAQAAAQSEQPLTRAQRQALELQRRARSQSAQGATRTQVRRLDLNETKGSRAHYDMNADAEYQARVARRAAQTAAQPAAPQAAPQQEDTVMQASRSAGKPAAGSGKSTTMACIIDKINHSREGHIITLEDPLEYLHRHDKCIVSQREICTDTANYLVSLRATLRQSPDVILLGEMRDHETIQTAMTAAETGHLILSSLHTTGAANTISRIMDVFEPSQQHQIAIQLSMVLQAVISQQLIPDVDGRNIPVFEVMRLTPAIRNMIRDNKIHQIEGVISTSSQDQMRSMDQSLLELYRKKRITRDTALKYAMNPEMLKRKLM